MPELPELVYDSLKQHKSMKLTLEKIDPEQIGSLESNKDKPIFIIGIGTTLFLCGSPFLFLVFFIIWCFLSV